MTIIFRIGLLIWMAFWHNFFDFQGKTKETFQNLSSDIFTLSLEDAVNMAVQANRTLASADDNVTQSRLYLAQTKSDFEIKIVPEADFSQFFQNGSFALGVSMAKKFPTGTEFVLSPVMEKIGGRRTSGMQLTLTQPLLRGLKPLYNLAGVKTSEYQVRTSQRNLFLTQVSVILLTINSVYEIIRNREILNLQTSSFERIKGYLESAIVKQKAGIATALDVYRAKIKMNLVESLVISSRESYQDSVDNLKMLLAIPLEKDIAVTAPLLYDLLVVDEDSAIESALKTRVELDQLRDMKEIYQLHAEATRHSFLPTLNLVVKYSTLPDFPAENNSKSENIEFGLSAGGDIRRSVERAEYEIDLLAIKGIDRQMNLRMDDIKKDVKVALRNLRRAEKYIEIQNEQVKQSKGKLELSKIKFSHGYADNFDILEAETELRQAEVDLITASIGYITGIYQFKAATGSLVEYESISPK